MSRAPQSRDVVALGGVIAGVVLLPLVIVGAFSTTDGLRPLALLLPSMFLLAAIGAWMLAGLLGYIGRVTADDQLRFMAIVYLVAGFGVLLRSALVLAPQSIAIAYANTAALVLILVHLFIPCAAVLVLRGATSRFSVARIATSGLFTIVALYVMLPGAHPQVVRVDAAQVGVTPAGKTLIIATCVLSLLVTIVWVRRGNVRPYGPDPWIAANLILVTITTGLYAFSPARFSSWWWASQLSSVAAFLVPAFGQLHTVFRFQSAVNEYVASQHARLAAALTRLQPPMPLDGEDAIAARGTLRKILSDPDAITPVFQPIIELETDKIVGVESLARFLGELRASPERWFAAARSLGMLYELDVACLQRAVRQFAQLPDDIYLGVNCSPSTLADRRMALDGGVLEISAWRRIVIEVTEQELIADYDRLVHVFARPRALGVRLAIDDMGAGYAGLQHVLGLKPDIIKLDISVTADIQADPYRRALVGALVAFSETTKALLVAEGVETREQCDALYALGVRHGQGYLFARPMPMPELLEHFAELRR